MYVALFIVGEVSRCLQYRQPKQLLGTSLVKPFLLPWFHSRPRAWDVPLDSGILMGNIDDLI